MSGPFQIVWKCAGVILAMGADDIVSQIAGASRKIGVGLTLIDVDLIGLLALGLRLLVLRYVTIHLGKGGADPR